MKLKYDLEKEVLKKQYVSKTNIVVICCLIIFLITGIIIGVAVCSKYPSKFNYLQYENDSLSIDSYFDRRENLSLSKLGDILYKNAEYPKEKLKKYKILIWKEGPSLERRHIYYFSSKRHDPFEQCSVKNCEISYLDEDLSTADAVVFSLQKFRGLSSLPNGQNRSLNQRWIFLTDQSPFNTFRYKDENDWRNYSEIFNWSMSYKIQSDIPVPYGRTLLNVNTNLTDISVKKLIPNMEVKQRDVLVAIKTSECGLQKKRVKYFEELQNYMDVDIFGKCANNTEDLCSSMSSKNCPKLNSYLFYLSFENSNCNQFMTEDLYYLAYGKGAIPIIMGPSESDCQQLLPPNSYIHTNNFKDPSRLAEYLLRLNATWNEELFDFHEWRKKYIVLNEHGYYGTNSFHYCRVCQALNYNDDDFKSYTDLSQYLSVEDNCGDF